MDWDLKKIEELAEIIEKYGLTEIEIKDSDKRIVLKKTPAAMQAVQALPVMNGTTISPMAQIPKPAVDFRHITERKAMQDELQSTKESLVQKEKSEPKTAVSSETRSGGKQVVSPTAGIFYRQSQPGNPPYAEVGQRVKKGDIVCLVEAMKMINELPAGCDGIVKAFLAENEQFVEYGAPLVIIEEE